MSNTSFAIDNNIANKLNSIEYKANLIVNSNKNKPEHLKFDIFNQELLNRINKIEDYQTRKDTHQMQIKKLEDSFYKISPKHNIYLKGFVSTIGYGGDISYYYKDFVGIGFLFDYQDKKFSNTFGSLLANKFYFDFDKYSDEFYNTFKPDFKTHTFVGYLSIKPFKNGFHLDVGISFSNIKANGLIKQNAVNNVEETVKTVNEFTYDELHAKYLAESLQKYQQNYLECPDCYSYIDDENIQEYLLERANDRATWSTDFDYEYHNIKKTDTIKITSYDNVTKTIQAKQDVVEYQIDHYTPKPYINVGYDFDVKNIIFSLNLGVISFNTKTSKELYEKMDEIIELDNDYDKESNTFYVGRDYKTYEYISRAVPQVSKMAPYVRFSVGYKFAF